MKDWLKLFKGIKMSIDLLQKNIKDNIIHYKDVLSLNYCEEVLKFAKEQKLENSKTFGESIEGFRKANVTWLKDTNSRIVQIWDDVVEFATGVSKFNFEIPHIVEYEVGGEYKEHYDCFQPNTDYYEEAMGKSGQRTHTIILYLNEDFTGGETYFPKYDAKIKPKTGSICIWRNVDENGEMAINSLHAGLPVESGTKYIMVTWVREKPFRMQ